MIYSVLLGINSPLVRVPPLRLPRSVVGLSVCGLGTEIQVGQSWLRAVGAVVAEAWVVAWSPSECRSISKEVAAVFFESSAVVVCGVLFRERHRIVASGAGTNGEGRDARLNSLGSMRRELRASRGVRFSLRAFSVRLLESNDIVGYVGTYRAPSSSCGEGSPCSK